jgi:hypothetical protein
MNDGAETVDILLPGEDFFRGTDGVIHAGAESTLIGNYDFHKTTE